MEDFSKNGRKLRPRRATGAASTGARREEGPAYSTSSNFRHERTENGPYGEHRNTHQNSERRDYGERRNTRTNTEGRSYGERRNTRTNSEGRSYGEHKGYGERRNSHPKNDFSNKPVYGQSKFARKSMSKKAPINRASEEGISRMLSRKPILSEMKYSDNDYVKTPIQEEVRLNKFIANSGVCSRREADTLIQAGVVTVNGNVVTELGTKVNIYKDEVKFNGERLKGEEKVYLVMNKPRGYVTTASDPHAEKTVMELLKGCPFRVFPVGRLDKSTTGVLMFTNDGELAEKLTHPSYDKKKIYQVSLDKPLKEEDYEKILAGVDLTDGKMAADELEFIDADDHRKLGIEIHSGKNRIVRRLFEALGYEVKALDRVYFAGLTKKGLKKGEWRKLSDGEVNILKMGAYV